MTSAPAEAHESLAARAFAATFNHLLEAQPWSRERLQRHAGKNIRVNLPPLLLRLALDDDGFVAACPDEGDADATLGVSPLSLLHLATGKPLPQDLIHTAGDAGLAVDFGNVMQNLRWDAEEDLAKVFGDVVGHRMARAGAGFFAFQRKAARNLMSNFTKYWIEERPLLARHNDVADFVGAVDVLRDDVERLEKRIARLAGRN